MKKILVALLLLFIILQFFRIEKTNPPVNKEMDFLTIKNTPETTAKLIRNGCYDCHSNETRYPWYTNVQPVAWFLQSHIKEGRSKLNFSTFATYEPKRQAHKLDEAAEMIEERKMPLESYILGHPEAKFTDSEYATLGKYFEKTAEEIRLANDLPVERAPAKKSEIGR